MSKDFISSCGYLDAQEAVEGFLKNHLAQRAESVQTFSPQLLESIQYSLFTPGKRFRPVLCQYTSLALGGSAQKVLPFAAAIEMVHAYSLIHDDLPCMDNDDERRGVPTNHKKYGEALALLAGDALLTESFYLTATAHPECAGALIELLSYNSGMSGMVGGQAMDMGLGLPISGLEAAKTIHHGKTAALIATATEGAAIIHKVSPTEQKKFSELGFALGLCFQIKDDLLDHGEDLSEKSYIHHLGVEQTEVTLKECSQQVHNLIADLPSRCAQYLLPFLEFNLLRDK